MIRLLSERENGILCPLLLRRAETARRSFNLVLSTHIEVQEVHKGSVNSLDLDVAETRYLLSGGSDATISIHDTQWIAGSRSQTYPQVCHVTNNGEPFRYSVETVQWYQVDNGLFTSSGADQQLRIWDTNSLKVADTFAFGGLVYSHHMSPVARKHCLIAVGAGRSTVKLVDVKSGSASHQLKGHDSCVYTVQWSSRDEFLLATGSVDRKVILWDVRKAKGGLMVLDQHNCRKSASKHCDRTAHDGTVNSLRFTPDGLHLVTFGTDNRVRLWEACTGDLLAVNYGVVHNTVKKTVHMQVVAESSPPVLFVPSDSAICVYDLFKGEHLATLSGHYNFVNCCVSHPYTQYLFSGGTDRNILVWTPESESIDCEDSLSTEHGDDQGDNRNPSAVTADTWSSDEET